MPLPTMTATAPDPDPSFPTGAFLAIAALWVIGYLIHCAIWPYRACRHCGGTGRSLAPNGKAWRPCRACKGRPARHRAGHRALNHLRGLNNNRRDR